MVRECIRAGIAGVRIDDQPIEGKRRTQSAGVTVVPLDQAIARYRAAVDMKNELDPDFVIMAQCYARDAENSGLDDSPRSARGLQGRGGCRLGSTRIPTFGRGDQERAALERRAVLVHEGQAAAISVPRGAPRARDQHRMVPRFHASRHVGCALGLHDRLSGARDRSLGGLRRTTTRQAISGAARRPRWRRADKQRKLEERYFGRGSDSSDRGG